MNFGMRKSYFELYFLYFLMFGFERISSKLQASVYSYKM